MSDTEHVSPADMTLDRVLGRTEGADHPAAPSDSILLEMGELPTPGPPNIGLPVDRVPGDYVDRGDPEADAAEGTNAITGPLGISPVPSIANIPYGGKILDAGTLQGVLNQVYPLGSKLNANVQPMIMVIMVWTLTGANWQIIAESSGDSPLSAGASLSTALGSPYMVLPVAHVTLLCAVASPLSYVVIGYPL